MVLDGFTVLCGGLCLLRFSLGLVIAVVGVSALRDSRRKLGLERRELIENRYYLLLLSATVLIGLNVVSWPLLYLLLQSYVAEWPGIMCIYGVTQIGAGTPGTSRFLPGLLATLQWIKPLLIFVSGAGAALYLVNRRTSSALLLKRVLLVLAMTGLLSVADAVIEGAYLAIPKTEVQLAGGCCTNALTSAEQVSRFTPRIHIGDSGRPYLTAAYYSLNLAIFLGLLAMVKMPSRRDEMWMWLLIPLVLVSIPVNLLFLVEVAAPAILGLPFHHCPYDLVAAAPESVLAVPLFLLGCFSVGWSCVIGLFGRCAESERFLREFVSKLLFIGSFGYSGSLMLLSIELLLS